MPSQEEYLDSLLKNLEHDSTDTNVMEENESLADEPTDDDTLIENAVSEMEAAFGSDDNLNLEEDELDLDEIYSDMGLLSGDKGEREAGSKADSVQQDAAPDIEALSYMSEEEIDRLLAAGGEEASASGDKENLPDDEELLNMFGGLEDDDLQDIQEMLHRADNNEAVNKSPMQSDSGYENESGELSGGEDGSPQNSLSEKEKRAQQKRLRKQERAAARAKKAAAKAAAKAEKAAAKAQKAAEKAAAKAGVAVVGGATAVGGAGASEGGQDEKIAATDGKKRASNTLFDTSLLDSIVAGAEQTIGEGKAAAAPKGSRDINSGEDAGGSAAAQEENAPDEFDLIMDSILGGDGGTDLLSQNDSKIPDFVEPNTGETDAEISEHEEPEPKKGGFFAKILNFLTEDDEDEEEDESASLQLSEENLDILNDLDQEKAGAANKKKKKGAAGSDKGEKGKAKKGKEKKPKAKKPKAKKPKAPKKPKKPKPEKPKKEKVPEPEPLIPEQKLTLKKVLPIVLVAVSLCVFIIVLTNVSVDFIDKQAALEAYEAGDYQTCFQNLYGKDLNETEQFMFGKSESILHIRLWLREYEMFAQDGAEVEALESLIQTVNDYPQLYDYAIRWDAGAEVASGYQTVLNILLEKYGVTEEQAKAIAAEKSDRKYTRMIVDIVLGKGFDLQNGQISTSESERQTPVSESEQQTSAPEPDQTILQDVLPEEEGLGEGEFIGN